MYITAHYNYTNAVGKILKKITEHTNPSQNTQTLLKES